MWTAPMDCCMKKEVCMLHKEIMGDNGSVFCEMNGFFKGEKCA